MEIKRVVSMGLVIVFMCSSTFAIPVNITDMPKGWSKPAVEEAIDKKILVDDYGKIRPMEHLTRAEMALGINNVFGATEKSDISGYFDVEKDKWYYEEMQKAVKMGTFAGYGDGRLRPNENISRQEMFSVLYNALEMEEGDVSYLSKFRDNNLVGDWAKGRVASMVQNNYVAGNADGRLNPIGNMSREEFAQIMKNIFKGYYNTPGTYTNVPEGNIIISTRGVTLKDTTVTGDLIIADGVGDGEVALNNVTVTGRTIVRGGGENSIKLLNGSVLKGKVIINSNIGKVRIYNSKSTVNEIGVKSEVILDGDFGKVSIDKPVDIEVKGDIKDISVNHKSKVKISKGNVENIEVNNGAKGTYIYGSGKVENVNVKANNVSIKTEGTKVTADRNTSGVTAGDKDVDPGKTVTVKKTSSGGGSSSGGSSSSGGNKKPSDGSSTEAKLPEFKVRGDSISLGKDWSKYEVAYSDNSGDFSKDDIWKSLSISGQDWYSGVSPVFTTKGNGTGTLHVGYAFLSGRKYVEPTYFAIRLKENTKLNQIIQVREIAEVNEKENENKIVIGKDFENYRYDITYSRYGNENKDSFEDKEFYSSELVLPYDAKLKIYKLGQNGRLNSARYIVNYTHTEKTIAIPDFKVDTIAGGIDLGAEHSAYKYGFANDTESEPLTWYSATSNFIDGERIVSAFSKYITIAKSEDLTERQIIDVGSYNPGEIIPKISFDRSNSTISIKDDDYSLYEYAERSDDITHWYTFDSNELEVDEEYTVYVRKKATKDKFASESISFEAKIKPECPDFEVDKLNGKVIVDDFETLKSNYEYKVSKYGEGSYKDFTSEEDLIIPDNSEADTYLFIRTKETESLLPSDEYKIKKYVGVVEEVSEILNDATGKSYREIELTNYYDERVGQVIKVAYKEASDKYLNKTGEGKTLADLEIKEGDLISYYSGNEIEIQESDGGFSKAVWIGNIVVEKVALALSEAKIKPECPDFEVDKLNGKVIVDDFETLKSNYEYKVSKHGEGSYKDFTSEEDLIIPDNSEADTYLFIRTKETESLLPSDEYEIKKYVGVVEEVSEILNDATGKSYREIELTDYYDERAGQVIKVAYKEASDKYLNKTGEGKTLAALEIKEGDLISYYSGNEIEIQESDGGFSKAVWIGNIVVEKVAALDTNLALSEAIEDVTGLGIMENYEDGTFHENDSITRAEMAVIVGKMTGVSERV